MEINVVSKTTLSKCKRATMANIRDSIGNGVNRGNLNAQLHENIEVKCKVGPGLGD